MHVDIQASGFTLPSPLRHAVELEAHEYLARFPKVLSIRARVGQGLPPACADETRIHSRSRDRYRRGCLPRHSRRLLDCQLQERASDSSRTVDSNLDRHDVASNFNLPRFSAST
jgi:hypothetical protein